MGGFVMDGQQHMGIRPPGKALPACPLFLHHLFFLLLIVFLLLLELQLARPCPLLSVFEGVLMLVKLSRTWTVSELKRST